MSTQTLVKPKALRDAAAAGGTQYEVIIHMDTTTVNTLHTNGFQLYAFKAVRGPVGGGQPLVWFTTDNYSALTNIKWTEDYLAYTSADVIENGAVINASFRIPIDLGDRLVVNEPGGIGDVTSDGTPGQIAIVNELSQQYTTGIMQNVDGVPKPLCAFPLFGGTEDDIVPIEKVLLMFATQQVDTGTVIEKAFTQCLLIDLTGAPGNSREVTYVINTGWEWGNTKWGTQFPPNSKLSPILINQ